MSTEEKIRKIVADNLGIRPEDTPMDVSFESIGGDYTDKLLIVMGMEDAFEISISDEEADKITTLREAIGCVEAKRNCQTTKTN